MDRTAVNTARSVVVTVRTVSTVSTGAVTATVDAGGSKTPDGGTATGACATTAATAGVQ